MTPAVDAAAYSDLILVVAPYMEMFLCQLFGIELPDCLQAGMSAQALLYFRERFIEKKMRMHLTAVTAEDQQWEQLHAWVLTKLDCASEQLTQSQIIELGDDLWAGTNHWEIWRLQQWCQQVPNHFDILLECKQWSVFWQPQRLGPQKLMLRSEKCKAQHGSQLVSSKQPALARDDFSLIPSYWGEAQAMLHAQYCQYCHERSVDYCRTGFFRKKVTSNLVSVKISLDRFYQAVRLVKKYHKCTGLNVKICR